MTSKTEQNALMVAKATGKRPPMYLEGNTDKGKFVVFLPVIVAVEHFKGTVKKQTERKSGIIVPEVEVDCVNLLTSDGNALPMHGDYEHVKKLWVEARAFFFADEASIIAKAAP